MITFCLNIFANDIKDSLIQQIMILRLKLDVNTELLAVPELQSSFANSLDVIGGCFDVPPNQER